MGLAICVLLLVMLIVSLISTSFGKWMVFLYTAAFAINTFGLVLQVGSNQTNLEHEIWKLRNGNFEIRPDSGSYYNYRERLRREAFAVYEESIRANGGDGSTEWRDAINVEPTVIVYERSHFPRAYVFEEALKIAPPPGEVRFVSTAPNILSASRDGRFMLLNEGLATICWQMKVGGGGGCWRVKAIMR